MKEAIILCGGLGSRLRSVIGEKQKTMTLIDDTPFLVRVINYLKSYRVTRVIFATGYKSEEIKDYFGEKYYFGVEINYSEEKTQLGTGGAIRNALSKVKYDNVLVLNGDTLFEADLYKLKNNFTKLNADISIICKEVSDKSRYGTVKISFNEKHNQVKGEGLIVSFDEKIDESEISDKENLYINGGIYLMKKSLIETIPENEKVSLEKDLIPLRIKEQKIIGGVVSGEKFIDIGTPESLSQYKEEQNIKNEI